MKWVPNQATGISRSGADEWFSGTTIKNLIIEETEEHSL